MAMWTFPPLVFEADTVADEIIAALGDGPSKGRLAVVEQMQKMQSPTGQFDGLQETLSIKYKSKGSKGVGLMSNYNL